MNSLHTKHIFIVFSNKINYIMYKYLCVLTGGGGNRVFCENYLCTVVRASMSSSSTARRALIAYRHGLRAARIAFDQDTRMLLAARQQMRDGMIHPPNPEVPVTEQIKLMEDVALFLRKNVVQGKRVESRDPAEDPTYHLNIHKDTELGDNDDVKQPSRRNTLTSGTVTGGGCCGGSGVSRASASKSK